MGRSGHSPDDVDLFRSAVSGTRPLADRERVTPTREIVRQQRPNSKPKQSLRVERDGDRVVAYIPGVSRKQLRTERGKDPDATLDLHGLRAAQARERLSAFVSEGANRGLRRLLVVTGQGKHSSGAGVLRDVAIEVLTESHSSSLLGFISGGKREGSTGALFLLLKRL